jgi:hypothetical protein
MLSEALVREGLRGQEEADVLRARLAETQSRSAELAAELQRERTRRETSSEQDEAASEAQAEARSRALANDCAELRERLMKKQEESARLEKSLLPAAEKAAMEEKQRSAQLREELISAKASMEKAELQAQALRKEWLEAEAQAQRGSLQSELEAAESRNANLEEQCAQTWNQIERAKASAASSSEKLELRGRTLSSLKSAMREHTRCMMDQLSTFSNALNDAPGGSSAVADSSSRSPPADGGLLGGGSLLEGNSRRCMAGSQKAPMCPRSPPLGNPEAPTIAYPPDSGDSDGRVAMECHGASSGPVAKRRRLPGEMEGTEAGDGADLVADRQRSSSSPPLLVPAIGAAIPGVANNGVGLLP